MNNLGSSRPLPAYTTLAFVLLTITQSCFAAEDSSPAHAPSPNGVVNVDSQLLNALMTPISHLVVSPYENPTVLEDPLGEERKTTLEAEARLDEETLSILSAIHQMTYESYRTSKYLPPSEFNMSTPEDLLSSAQAIKDMRALVVTRR
jgi:hypothetical protein